MKLCDWEKQLLEIYAPAALLSDRNGKKVLKLRHKTLSKDMVLITGSENNSVYGFLKKITHPGIVRIYDALEFEDGYAVLEEYLSGITVAQVLETGLYSYSGAKSVILPVCGALDLLHHAGFVYRDLKPENVFITDGGEVKVIDFDSCRVSDTGKPRDTVSLGTPGYASPEQYGVKQSDARSDVYAVGVLLNVMLTGVHPSEKLAPGKAGKIVLKCTQISPEKRYSSTKELMRAL